MLPPSFRRGVGFAPPLLLSFLASVAVSACSSTSPSDASGSGGLVGSGASAGVGGNVSSGGVVGSGAAVGSGGAASDGGSAGLAGSGGEGQWATLREAAAAAGRYIGAAVSIDALRSDSTYGQILAQEFDEVTPENAMKWEPLAPTADTYDWVDADEIVDTAETASQSVRGHTLVWHQQYPTWLSASMTADELRAAMQSHIETTMTRYAGRVRAWDVVNEAVDTASASGYTESIFYDILGPDYIADAFRWAREADPDALLYYNEVGIERLGAKSDFTYELISSLLADDVPIDGIGFQSHVSIHRYPSLSNLQQNLARFADLGLLVNLSEIDARTLLLPGDTELRWEVQRITMQQLAFACVLEPGCEGITFWGFTDNYSWINDEGDPDDPLLFDRSYQKKPAYQGVLDGLLGRAPVEGESVLDNGDFSSGLDAWSGVDADLALGTEPGEACTTSRASDTAGFAQLDLEAVLSEGAYSFMSEVRIDGSAEAVVDAMIVLELEGGASEEFNIATVPAEPGTWTELSGYLGLGFEVPVTGASLVIDGPPAGIELCLRGATLRPLSPE